MSPRSSTARETAIATMVRSIELSEAFQLCVLVGGRWSDLREVLEGTIRLVREASPEGLVVRWTRSTRQLLDEHHPQSSVRHVIVFDARGSEADDEYRALNAARDTLRQRGRATLLILLTDETEGAFAAAAPDLRSIHAAYVRVPLGWPNEDDFGDWIAGCRRAFEARVQETEGAAELYSHGVYSCAYQLDRVPNSISAHELRDVMASFRGHTGWRPWWVPSQVHPPYSVGPGELECWMLGGAFQDPAHSDFWRASSSGRFYLMRGYQEDSNSDRIPPGQTLSSSLPIWRAAEYLLHAQQAANALAHGDGWVHLVARWEGLSGRRWSAWPKNDWDDDDAGRASASEVSSSVVCLGKDIRARLSELTLELVRPLADAFLATLSPSIVEQEVLELLGRHPR